MFYAAKHLALRTALPALSVLVLCFPEVFAGGLAAPAFIMHSDLDPELRRGSTGHPASPRRLNSLFCISKAIGHQAHGSCIWKSFKKETQEWSPHLWLSNLRSKPVGFLGPANLSLQLHSSQPLVSAGCTFWFLMEVAKVWGSSMARGEGRTRKYERPRNWKVLLNTLELPGNRYRFFLFQ